MPVLPTQSRYMLIRLSMVRGLYYSLLRKTSVRWS
jgi:hypothetical protein